MTGCRWMTYHITVHTKIMPLSMSKKRERERERRRQRDRETETERQREAYANNYITPTRVSVALACNTPTVCFPADC